MKNNNIRSLLFDKNINEMMKKDSCSLKRIDISSPNHVRCKIF